MITVITATLAIIYLFGYTLNVITLFALILGLSLIVDDTIIMVEAIDAAPAGIILIDGKWFVRRRTRSAGRWLRRR